MYTINEWLRFIGGAVTAIVIYRAIIKDIIQHEKDRKVFSEIDEEALA